MLKRLLDNTKNITSENFSHFCTGIQAIILSLGIIAGGFWAYYKYESLEEEKRVESALKREEIELDILNKKSKGITSLDISLEVNKIYNLKKIGKKGFGVILRVDVKNNGTRDAIIDIKNEPVSVCKIETEQESTYCSAIYNASLLHFNKTTGGIKAKKTEKKHVQIGSTKELFFYLEVKLPGLYQAHFIAPADAIFIKEYGELEKRLFPNRKNNDKREMTWSANRFFVININNE